MEIFWCQEVGFTQLAHFMCVDTDYHSATKSDSTIIYLLPNYQVL